MSSNGPRYLWASADILRRFQQLDTILSNVERLANVMAAGAHRRGEHVAYWKMLAKELREGADAGILIEIALDDVAQRQPLSLTKFDRAHRSETRMRVEPMPRMPTTKRKRPAKAQKET
jgi:hypothetical protein